MRFELTTSTLARLRSTPELRPRLGYPGKPGSERDNTHRRRHFNSEFAFISQSFFERDHQTFAPSAIPCPKHPAALPSDRQ